MRKKKIYLSIFFVLGAAFAADAQVKILFDATKGEMSGNGDWVIDYDQTNLGVGSSGCYLTSSGHQSNPQQIPTPPQSGITSSTTDTYWSGALSSWAIDCVHQGYTVETLPWNGQITYGSTSNAQDLSHYKVYVVDEPNLVFTAAEKTAILQFVQHGGSLFMISDHNNSDRNGDGWDSPHIWNDLLSNNTVQPYPFGIYYDTVDFSQTTTDVSASSTDSMIHGPMGNVTKFQYSGGTTMTLNPSANPTVKGVIFQSGTTPGNTNVMFAYARYGSGKVAAIGDSSPFDDGTGNPTCSLYTDYPNDASGNNRLLIMNATIWLAYEGTTSVAGTEAPEAKITVYPNPANGPVNIACSAPVSNASISIYSITGALVSEHRLARMETGLQLDDNLKPGTYILKIQGDGFMQTSRFAIY